MSDNKEISLNEEQQLKVLKEWNDRPTSPPSLLELTKLAFPDAPDLDGRSKEGKAVKAFLATRQIKPRAAQDYQPKEKIDLTGEQKEYIANNVISLKAVEMAKILFKDDTLTNLCQETRTVNEFIKTLNTSVVFNNPDEVPEENYRPPKTGDRVLAKVNKYVHEGIDRDKISPKQKKDLSTLIGYLHTYRFLHQINTYDTQTDRELLESSFVRYTFDKNDLTQEEVDQYIVLSTEVVISSNIQATITMLQRQIEFEVQSGNKIPMTLVEASSTARNEYNQSVTRQQKLLSDLKVKRSDRMSKYAKENSSILNLVEMWKEEESRKKMLHLAELRKQSIEKEIENLSSLDEIKAKIMGLSEGEALNG